jgi:carbon storage regulator
MLVLTRKPGEKIVIGDNISVTVCATEGNKVRIAIDAPRHVRILRGELTDFTRQEPDPDLAAKPAEWRPVAPDYVVSG